MSAIKIEFTITGYSSLGSWSIKRYLTIDPEEDMEITVQRLVSNFSDHTEHKNWQVIEWSYPSPDGKADIGCLAQRDWFDTIKFETYEQV